MWTAGRNVCGLGAVQAWLETGWGGSTAAWGRLTRPQASWGSGGSGSRRGAQQARERPVRSLPPTENSGSLVCHGGSVHSCCIAQGAGTVSTGFSAFVEVPGPP